MADPLTYGFNRDRWTRAISNASPEQLNTLSQGLTGSGDPLNIRPLVQAEQARRAGGLVAEDAEPVAGPAVELEEAEGSSLSNLQAGALQFQRANDYRVSVAARDGIEKGADKSAEVFNLSQETDLDEGFVERNLDTVRNEQALRRLDIPNLAKTNPSLARFLQQNRHITAAAYDDFETLRQMEQIYRPPTEGLSENLADRMRQVLPRMGLGHLTSRYISPAEQLAHQTKKAEEAEGPFEKF